VAEVESLLDPVDAAERPDERGGGLLADAGHAGQAVARIAAQDGEVRVGLTGNVVFLRDFFLGHWLQLGQAAQRVQHADLTVVVDELEQVPVAGHHVDRRADGGGQGGDDVVRLVALVLGQGDSGGGQHLGDQRDLHGQAGRGLLGPVRFGPVRLVRRQDGDPERRPPVSVQAGHQPFRRPSPDQPGDRVEQAPDRVDRRSVRCRHRFRHPVERPVVQRRGVQQHQRAHPAILPRPAESGRPAWSSSNPGWPGR
jgi:hypothetical protein